MIHDVLTLPRLVLADFDDTLMLTRQSRIPILLEMVEAHGYQVSDETLAQYWGEPFPALLEALAPGIDHASFNAEYLRELGRHLPVPAPGAADFLATTRAIHARLAVVTSTSRALARADLEALGFESYVDAMWCAEDSPWHKPDPRVLDGSMSYARSLGLTPNEILSVGDAIGDWMVAREWGIPFVGVLSGTTSRSDFERDGLTPLRIMKSLTEVALRLRHIKQS